MIILLFVLSMFLTSFYAMSLITDTFFKYLKNLHLKENNFYRIVGYIELIFIIFTLISSKKGSQNMIFTFILLGWLILWGIFVRPYDMIVDKRKGYLFLVICIAIYFILSIINLNLIYLWIKTV